MPLFQEPKQQEEIIPDPEVSIEKIDQNIVEKEVEKVEETVQNVPLNLGSQNVIEDKIESKEDIPIGRPKRNIKPKSFADAEIPEPPSHLMESYYNLELAEESINHILKYIDELCIYINNVDQDMERSTEVNNGLNQAVNCYRIKLQGKAYFYAPFNFSD